MKINTNIECFTKLVENKIKDISDQERNNYFFSKLGKIKIEYASNPSFIYSSNGYELDTYSDFQTFLPELVVNKEYVMPFIVSSMLKMGDPFADSVYLEIQKYCNSSIQIPDTLYDIEIRKSFKDGHFSYGQESFIKFTALYYLNSEEGREILGNETECLPIGLV